MDKEAKVDGGSAGDLRRCAGADCGILSLMRIVRWRARCQYGFKEASWS